MSEFAISPSNLRKSYEKENSTRNLYKQNNISTPFMITHLLFLREHFNGKIMLKKPCFERLTYDADYYKSRKFTPSE